MGGVNYIVPKQHTYPVNDHNQCRHTQPVRMERIFDIAVQQPGNGMAYPAAGAPFKTHQLKRAKRIMNWPGRVA